MDIFPAAILVVVGIPLCILVTVFWVVLGHRWSLVVPFVLGLALILGFLRLAGLNPLGFFVSPGGWLWFGSLCFLTAFVVRGIVSVVHRARNQSYPRGSRPSDSRTRSLARRFVGALRSRGLLARLARVLNRPSGL